MKSNERSAGTSTRYQRSLTSYDVDSLQVLDRSGLEATKSFLPGRYSRGCEYVVDHERITLPDNSTFETVAINNLVISEIDRLDIIRASSAEPRQHPRPGQALQKYLLDNVRLPTRT